MWHEIGSIATSLFRKITNKQVLRRVSLFGFTAFIAAVVIRHIVAGESVITASPEAYCPWGGMENLYYYITSGGNFISHSHLSNLVVFIAVIATAVVARSGFCGWICPLGFLQELTTDFSNFIQKRVQFIRRMVKGLKAKASFLSVADRYLRYLKYLVLIWTVGGAALWGIMVFRDYDPWSALINIAEAGIGPGMIILIAMFVAALFVERPWCRYACPLGALSGLLAKLSPIFIKRQVSLCKNCAVCSKACPMGLPVHSSDTIKSVDCIGCLECIESCPREHALELKLGIPVIGK
jgi:polyferredoxin